MDTPDFPARIKQLLDLEKYDEVAEYARPLAEAGDAEGQFLLGYLYFTSADVEWSESLKWLQAAAAQDHAYAIYYLSEARHEPTERGVVTCGPPETPERCALLRKAAELGCRGAQRDLGCYLCVGEGGLAKDEIEGRKWYLKAALQGHSDAQYNVGFMFLLGEGGPVDIAQGIEWLERSAAAKDPDSSSENAAELLADIYEGGHYGVVIDLEKARAMRKRAAEIDLAFKEKYDR